MGITTLDGRYRQLWAAYGGRPGGTLGLAGLVTVGLMSLLMQLPSGVRVGQSLVQHAL